MVFSDCSFLTFCNLNTEETSDFLKQMAFRLEKIVCLRKSEVLLKECQFMISLKICCSMVYTVCHAPIPVRS